MIWTPYKGTLLSQGLFPIERLQRYHQNFYSNPIDSTATYSISCRPPAMFPFDRRSLQIKMNIRVIQLVFVSTVFRTVAIIAVIPRFAARKIKVLEPGADDCWIALALVMYLKMVRIARFLMVVVCLFCLSSLLLYFLLCRPLKFEWELRVQGVSGNQLAGWTATRITNLVFDLIILCLPVPVVWRLQIPRATEEALTSVFGLGLL